jgi:hypothetical protein
LFPNLFSRFKADFEILINLTLLLFELILKIIEQTDKWKERHQIPSKDYQFRIDNHDLVYRNKLFDS